MGTGDDAVLYKAEWVNPYPAKKVREIVFATTWAPLGVNPILVAATGVAPTGADLARRPPAPGFGRTRRAEDLTPAQPKGVPIDLTDGAAESDRLWRTRDGVVVDHDETLGNYRKGIEGAARFWSRAASALHDNWRWTRCVQWKGGSLTITFPKPRRLAGFRFTGSYRLEYYLSDHVPSMLDYKAYVSADGASWREVRSRDLYIPEEEGPQWVGLDASPVKAVRVHMRRNPATTHSYERGVSYIQVFEAKPDQGPGARP